MHISLLMALGASLWIGLISLIGVVVIGKQIKRMGQSIMMLVSLAVGGLMGDALIHILPESFDSIDPKWLVSLLTIGGMMLFLVLEKIMRWRHCHEINCQENESRHVAVMNITGDVAHNFIDGILIGASFILNTRMGVATSLAVLMHEIPQEMGELAILTNSRIPLGKIVLINVVSAMASLVGVLVVFLWGSEATMAASYVLPITAGGFIYLAASDLIPELHRHSQTVKQSVWQLMFVGLGVGVMMLMLVAGE